MKHVKPETLPAWCSKPPIYTVSSNWQIISRSNDAEYNEWIWGNLMQGLVFNGYWPACDYMEYGTLVRVTPEGEILAYGYVVRLT